MVPKCKECEWHVKEQGKYALENYYHYCNEPGMEKVRRKGKLSYLFPGTRIKAKELNTSPKWCPKRKEESR